MIAAPRVRPGWAGRQVGPTNAGPDVGRGFGSGPTCHGRGIIQGQGLAKRSYSGACTSKIGTAKEHEYEQGYRLSTH
ncbi:hypothetical protein L6452_39324 [Arctium lappa]|uniref:Uncharacterized protein n=1 Tax=Arctium lappa TaxID=4217 RepID=A0ACB8XT64_ARCLA|nr:hypothetical protein L6452_39324 [Arctium lappa]